ncbi:MAG TPA: methyltransferase [Polyangia bacterium]|jgi:SAM-dependent methyltransferase
MATDLTALVANLRSTCSFARCSLVSVGAGGGQLVDVYADAARLAAVDPDAAALARLRAALAERELLDRCSFHAVDFMAFAARADVVLFEFSLHELDDPAAALRHAAGLAPRVVVFDHSPGSTWAYHTAEEERVRASTAAIIAAGPTAVRTFEAEQRFADHAALLAKIAGQGPVAVARAAAFQGERDLVIPMEYLAATLPGAAR